MRKFVVIGASANPMRFSYKTVVNLLKQGFEVIPVGLRKGEIEKLQILTGQPQIDNIDTLLLYINPENQKKYYDYMIRIKPRIIIFNPNYAIGAMQRANYLR